MFEADRAGDFAITASGARPQCLVADRAADECGQLVARAGLDAVMAGQPVCVPGAVNKTLAYTSRLFPERIRYLMGKAGKMVE